MESSTAVPVHAESTGSTTIADLIGLAAAKHGDAPAVRHKVDGEWRDVSYAQFGEIVSEVGRGLIDLGIAPGDRVAILCTTRPEWSYVDFGITSAGAVVVPIYPTNSPEECEWVAGNSESRAIVCEDASQVAKIRAVRYAFMELGVDDGVIVARTDSLGAGLTKQIAFVREAGDIGDQYNAFLDCEEVDAANLGHGDVLISRDGKLLRPKRLPSNLYQFRSGTGEDRCVLDCIHALENGADLLWIETEKPHIGQIGGMVSRIREVIPNAKLVYNNSPSFNWTLNFRQQVFDAWAEAGKDVSAYDRAKLMSIDYDATDLAIEADERIRTFQRDSAAQAGIFHHLITLPTYHTAALSTDNLAKRYFGEEGMLGYVKQVQREEIRQGIACVKHQNMAGSDIGDDHKEYFAGEAALKAGGTHNTMNQFAA